MSHEDAKFTYRLVLKDKSEYLYDIKLDHNNAYQADTAEISDAEWTRLEYHQCPNCPLSASEHEHCPLASNIYSITHDWKDAVSHDEVFVEVTTPSRTTSTNTTLQKALSSLLGLLIGSSNCPHTLFYRSMAYFHLPFSTQEETFCRVTSSFLLLQLIKQQQTTKIDISLDNLKGIYSNIHIVNKHIAKRIISISKQDASVNAVVLLDLLSATIPLTFDSQLKALEKLYTQFIEHEQSSAPQLTAQCS